ncbi:hypothetical protein [Hydrogenobaculum phage 1]|uniref:hypothetical protein n=1 Tax=Hydrogenobaculum phage 1 TaxID=1732176 RepID=UPI000705BAB2|nr:hypothetical protein AUR69_gp15 [Hydrogenobaculum phage 1]ALG96926.1 hypothetical protein [Hydrogenobaculum phage 1]
MIKKSLVVVRKKVTSGVVSLSSGSELLRGVTKCRVKDAVEETRGCEATSNGIERSN